MENVKVIDATPETIHQYGMCGYKNLKMEGYRKKIEWTREQFAHGLKYRVLYSEEDGAVGGIEYMPGERAWRPVDAEGYMFIHCIYIMKKKYKGKGFGRMMLEACLKDAEEKNMRGTAVVTRKGTWMVGKELFIRNGFKVADKSGKDFELLVRKIDPEAPDPKFKTGWDETLKQYGDGLILFSSGQCPYAAKAVNEIAETAKETFGITPEIRELKDYEDAHKSACAFGTFYIVYNGELIAGHPISKTRFANIMKKILK